MNAVRPLLVLAATALLLTASASAEEPADAAAEWQQAYGTQDVVGVTVEPAAVSAGQTFRYQLEFAPNASVDSVDYQICRVGQACFAIGVPTVQEGAVWSLDTADLKEEVGEHTPTSFQEGERIGVQYRVFMDGEEEPRIFPEAPPCDITLPTDAWVACEETHYFAITIAAAESNGTPAVGVAALVAVLVALLVVRRRDA